MGDVVMTKQRRWGPLMAAAAAAFGLVLAAGCASAPASRPAVRVSESSATGAVSTPQAEPAVELASLELREGAPGVRLDLEATGPLVWTSYRDEAGNLVIELPNTVPAAQLSDLTPPEGLVASVTIRAESGVDRPLTRLVVATRQEAEHSLAAEGRRLQVQLLPVGTAEATVAAAEPLPRETSRPEPLPPTAPLAPLAPVPPSVAPMPTEAVAAGTPEHPAVSPPVSGAPASRLEGVELLAAGGSAVRIAGDGEFAYSSFRLENPERFVIDLPGIVNASATSTVNVGGEIVERVRVSQFKPQPQPISRVVFDLREAEVPAIERHADGLILRFGEAAAAEPVMQPSSTPSTTLAEDLAAGAAIAEAETAAPPAAVDEPVAQVATAESAVAEAAPMPSSPPAPPVAQEPVPASPATSDVALFEAADVEVEPPSAPAEPSPAAYSSQTIGGGQKRYVGEPISLSLKDADIKDILRSFAKISGLNVVVQPGVSGTVTVELESVPWDQALDQILKINGLGYELDGNIMRIAPVSQLRSEAEEAQKLAQAQALSIPLRTVLKRLSYAKVSEVQRILAAGGKQAILSQRGSVTVDQRTNTLIIKELPTYMDTVIAVIENLDSPEPQVMIEARIVETTKRFNRTLGINWGFEGIADPLHGNTTGLVFPNNVEGTGRVDLLTGGSNALLDISLGNVLNTFTLDAKLQAAESEGLINILSAPKVATLNNESASIQSGLQIPIQTVANNTVTVQFVNATLRLDVTPHVTAEGTVLMEINVQKREPQLAFAVVGATNAPISTKEARTRVIVRDGGTAVIGGIYKVSTDEGQDRVPGLANVPILGHLFKNRRKNSENEELLIFITPRVIKL